MNDNIIFTTNDTKYDLTDVRKELTPLQMVFDSNNDNSNWTFEFGKVFSQSKNFNKYQLNNKLTTENIFFLLKDKYEANDFRNISGSICLEIQNCNFVADKDWIVREPNYDYAQRELEGISHNHYMLMTFQVRHQKSGKVLHQKQEMLARLIQIMVGVFFLMKMAINIENV